MDALTDLLYTWHSVLDQQKLVRILFVDFAKAFYRVDHIFVINKLISLSHARCNCQISC